MVVIHNEYLKSYFNSCITIVKKNGFNSCTPDHLNDIAWTNVDLSIVPEYKNWDDFEHPEIDYLENVMM